MELDMAVSKSRDSGLRRITTRAIRHRSTTPREYCCGLYGSSRLPCQCWNQRVYVWSLRWNLNVTGFLGRMPQNKPLLMKSHKQARVYYAKAHINEVERIWQKVLWTDETKQELSRRYGTWSEEFSNKSENWRQNYSLLQLEQQK